MTELHHEVQIQATPDAVFNAIATEKGLRSWWTGDSRIEPRAGGIAEFGFLQGKMHKRMRVAEYAPGKRTVWEVLEGPKEWIGTRLAWDITQKNGVSTLHFVHGGWPAATSFCATCNTIWGELMHRIKDYAEGRAPGPRWQD